jgi:CRISPR/Cas system CSM-associated protein Csm3 (group 7 of RAMP superfamily)
MVHLHIMLHLKWRTAFHTTGNRWKWGADKALAQRYDGAYALPATSLKGALRDQVERLLRGHGHPVCAAPDPGRMCPDPDNLCLACEVFGNPRRPSPLRFVDVLLPEDQTEPTQIRAGVAISRHRRAAVPQRLYFVETTAAGPMKTRATITGFFPTQEAAEKAAALVVLAAKALPALGAGRTRGLGWLAEVEAECTIDGQPVDAAALERYWSQWLGGGQ